ncbi:MAG: type II methionyl aminopeptidase [Candidatus Syntropharchaeia archaeon]
MEDKYRKAGEIISEVREEVVKRIDVGIPLLEIAEFVENSIREKGASPAFPCNISRNDEAAHVTPSAGDKSVFGEDMIKIDLGAHIDGYIADTAITVDLSGNPELVEASESALSAALEIIKEGVSTAEIGAVIEKTIRERGYMPIVNLTGHGLQQYVQHAPPQIPNVGRGRGVILKEGDVIAIEPFATDGAGRVTERGTAEIYQFIAKKPVRFPPSRELLKKIEVYKTLPFAKRWLNVHRLDMALRKLEEVKAIRSYPALKEEEGGLVSQAEHTVIVRKDGCEVIT